MHSHLFPLYCDEQSKHRAASNSATVLAALVSCAFAGKIMEKKTKIGGYLVCSVCSSVRVFLGFVYARVFVFDKRDNGCF